MSATPLLSVDRVSKRFATVLAVDELSFEARRGEVFALLGPNGAGKSTTVRMLAGITQPDSGTITFRLPGAEPARSPDRSRLGYLPEERGLYPEQRVLPTLVYLAALRGLSPAEARRRAEAWLERFGLAGRANDRLGTLSKGNQQKVQFIAAVLHEPALAVLDEPFSGFDPVNQDLVSAVIRELRSAGMTVVLSAHHMDLVETLADRVLLMHRGRAVLHGTLREVRASSGMGKRLDVTLSGAVDDAALAALPGVERVLARTATTVRLALRPGARVGDALRALADVAEVVDVRSGTPTLREVYLAAVGEGAFAPGLDAAGRREEGEEEPA